MSALTRRKFLSTTALGAASLYLNGLWGCSKKAPGPPNIVFILADDLGYGDLGCYGQKRFQTPNLDRMAAQGMRFTQHYAGSTVCAPSRSSLMTGQHTGHTPVRGNKAVQPEGQTPLPPSAITAAEALKEAGYATGAFGKWGLGYPGSGGDPIFQGFDEFFGYNCQRAAHNYYPRHLWHNQEKVLLEENEGYKTGVYGPDLIHEKTLRFIEDHKEGPFFLFVPSIIPHAELFAPEEYMARFRGRFDPEKSYMGVDSGERYREGAYGSQPEAHAAFAAMVTLLDHQAGEILKKLEELGIGQNTLVLFSSDNGPHLEGGADPDYFDSNGPLRGYKRDLYEGGIRVPLIARWPRRIKPGSVSGHISAFWDFLPTVCDAAGCRSPENMDGISFFPELMGEKGEAQRQHEYLYWEFHEQGGKQAVRMGRWKAVRMNIKRKDGDKSIKLYDLERDAGEAEDVAAGHPEIVQRMEAIMREARTESELFSF